MTSPEEFESLDTLLGVKIEAPAARAPKAERTRFTEWNNFHAFTFGGYVARVFRNLCGCCGQTSDVLEGVFVEEVHLPSGTRRMTQLGKGGDWPAQGTHRKEVTQVDVAYCALCVGDLGFSREVDSKGQPFALVLKEGV